MDFFARFICVCLMFWYDKTLKKNMLIISIPETVFINVVTTIWVVVWCWSQFRKQLHARMYHLVSWILAQLFVVHTNGYPYYKIDRDNSQVEVGFQRLKIGWNKTIKTLKNHIVVRYPFIDQWDAWHSVDPDYHYHYITNLNACMFKILLSKKIRLWTRQS